jgi:hypothetical protein
MNIVFHKFIRLRVSAKAGIHPLSYNQKMLGEKVRWLEVWSQTTNASKLDSKRWHLLAQTH